MLDEVNYIIESDSFSVKALLQYLREQKRKRVSNSRLDIEFIPSLVYLATETKEGFVPQKLVSFVLKRKECRRYGYQIVWGNRKALFGKSEERLVDFPSLVCFGLNDERYFVDQQMTVFGRGKSFFRGLKGLEGTLTGKDSKDPEKLGAY